MLRSVHGPAGLHSGYGSCFDFPTLIGYPYVSLPGRLARPVLLSGGSPLGPRGCLVPLSGVGGRCQPGEIQFHSISSGPVSRGGDRRADFYGFSFARSRLQAVVNRRRISALRCASCQLVAVAAGNVVLPVASGSRQSPADAVSPDLHSPLLGSVGSVGSCGVVSGLSPGPTVVASRGITSLVGFLSVNYPQIWTFGPTLPTSAGELTCAARWFLAFGTSRRLFSRSMPGSCWRCSGVSSASSPFCLGPQWRCFVTTSPRSHICARRGGTRSPALNNIAQEILRWAESLHIRLAPQFIPGICNVLADSLSRPHQLPSSEWSLNMGVFRSLARQRPVMIDLFATSDNHRCSIYFSPFRDPLSAGMDALLQSWDGLLAYAFPPWSILPEVLAKLRVSNRALLTLVAPYWPQPPWFVDLLQLSVAPPVVLPA